MNALKALITRDQDGVGMTEFAFVLALVTILCIAGYQTIGGSIGTMLEPVLNTIH